MILAIDSSVGTSVALIAGGAVLAEADSMDSRGHAEWIGLLIRDCLVEAATGPESVTEVAVGMGPGPFTGLRVGIAAANAFAFSRGIPLLRVSSHDAIALGAYSSEGAESSLLVTTDARRKERYWSSFRGLSEFGVPIPAGGPGLAKPDEIPKPSDGAEGFRTFEADRVSAAWLGLLAERLQSAGGDFVGPEPLYLRSPDVTPSNGPKRVTR